MRLGRRDLAGIAIVLLAGTSYSLATIAAKLGYERGAPPATLISIRFAGSALVLSGLVALLRLPRRVDRRRLVALAAMGAVSAVVAGLFFGSLARIPASTATLLLYAHPALVAAASFALGREHVGPAKVAALVLGLAGVALVVGRPGGAVGGLGIVMALGGAVALAAFILMARVVVHMHPLVSSAVVLAAAAVVFTVPAAAVGALRWPPAGAWGWMALVAVFTASAVSLFLAAVRHLGPTRASIGATVEPVVTVILGVIVLGETLSALQALGGVLVVAAVAILPMVEHGPISAPELPPVGELEGGEG